MTTPYTRLDESPEREGEGGGAEKQPGEDAHVAYAFTINFIFGAGVLGLPYVFEQAGIITSVVTMSLCTVLGIITIQFLIDTLARTNAIVRCNSVPSFNANVNSQNSDREREMKNDTGSLEEGLMDGSSMTNRFSGSIEYENQGVAEGNQSTSNNQEDDHSATDGTHDMRKNSLQRKVQTVTQSSESLKIEEMMKLMTIKHGPQLEVNQLCRLFFGWKMQLVYNLSIFCFVFGCLWLFSVIFVSSTLATIPIPGWTTQFECDVQATPPVMPGKCNDAYLVWLALFAVLASAFTVMDMTDQKIMQMSMTCMAMLGVLIMCITSGVALWTEPVRPGQEPPYVYDQPVEWVQFSGFAKLLTAAMFAQNCHHGVPSLVSMVRDKPKSIYIFGCATLSTLTAYCALGIWTTLYLGSRTEKLVQLNWREYVAGFDLDDVPPWVTVIRIYILIFPAVLCIASFPLNAIALANNIETYVPKSCVARLSPKNLKIATRLSIITIPFACAALSSDASLILTYVGLFAFVLEFWMPCLLHLRSIKITKATWGEVASKTPYSGHFSHPGYAYFVLLVTFVACVYTVISMAMGTV